MSDEPDVIIERLDTLEATITELQERVSELELEAEAGQIAEETDIRSFVETVGPGTHVQRAVALGAYLEQHDEANGFTTNDIADGYARIRTPKAANLSDVLRRAEQQEFVMPLDTDGQEKRWQLAVGGEKLLDELREATTE